MSEHSEIKHPSEAESSSASLPDDGSPQSAPNTSKPSNRTAESRSQAALESLVLQRVNEVIQATHEIDSEAINSIADSVRQLFEFDRVSLATHDPETNLLHMGPASGTSTFSAGQAMSVTAQHVAEKIGSSSVGVFDVDGMLSLMDSVVDEKVILDIGFKTTMIVVLRWQDELLGVLSFLSFKPNAYNETHMAIASRLGSSFSFSISATNRIRNLESEERAHEAVYGLVNSLVGESTLQAAFDSFTENLTALPGVDRASIAIFDDSVDYPYIAAGFDSGSGESDWSLRAFKPPQELKNKIFTEIPTLVSHTELVKLSNRYEPIKIRLGEGYQTMAGVGIMWRGMSIGTIALWSLSEHSINQSTLKLLAQISSQVAGAIGYAQLRNRQDSDLRNEIAIAEMVTAINSTDSIDSGFAEFTRFLHDFFGASRASVQIFAKGTLVISENHSYTSDAGYHGDTGLSIVVPAHISDAFSDEEPGIIDAEFLEQNSAKFPIYKRLMSDGIRSGINTRLRWHGDIVGSLSIFSDEDNSFGERDKALLKKLNNEIAGAIGYMLINKGIEAGYSQQANLAQIGQIVGSALDIDSVFTTAMPIIRDLVDFDEFHLTITDVEASNFVVLFDSRLEETGLAHNRIRDLEGSLTALVMASNTPVRVSASESSLEGIESPITRNQISRGIISAVGAPLTSDGVVFGSMMFRSKSESTYESVPDDLLLQLSAQLSGAIAYHRVNERLSRELLEQSTLARISEVVGSELDLKTAFDEVGDTLQKLVPFDSMFASTFDFESEARTNVYVSSKFDTPARPGVTRPYAGTISGAIANAQIPLRINLNGNADWEFGDPLHHAVERGEKSIVALPLVSEGMLFGTLEFHSSIENAYDDLTDEYLERLTRHLAGAIAYDQVNSTLEAELIEQSALARMGQIIGSELEIDSVFDQVADELNALIEFDVVFISVIDPTAKNLKNILASGPLANEFSEKIWFEVTGPNIEKMVYTQSPLRSDIPVEEPADHPKEFHFARELGLRSALLVPLISEGSQFALLQFRSREEYAYDDLSDEFLSRIAEQLAGAVAYSQVNEKLEIEVAEQTTISRISQLIGSSGDIGLIFDDIAEAMKSLFSFDTMLINVLEPETDTRYVLHLSGQSNDQIQIGDRHTTKGTLTELVVDSGEIIRSVKNKEDANEGSLHLPTMQGDFRAIVAAPLVSQGKVFGTFQLRSSDSGEYSASQNRLIMIVAEQISGAMARAELVENQIVLALERERSEGLESQNQELVQIQQTREQFLGMVTHELRTPLTSISAFTDILGHNRDGTLTERQFQQLNAVSRNATQLAELIDDLIHMSRMERGEFNLTFDQTDLVELVKQVSESMAPVVQHRGQRLITNIDIAKLRLDLDHSRMTQVLNNLVSNASKFSPQGSTVTVGMQLLDEHVQIEVSDEGAGIEMTEVEAVFDPFYRIESETVRNVPGTGLGLHVARTIVRQHGGDISVVTGQSIGTTLRIVLPIEVQG